jgi:glutaconyl-CoA/methylmalonyl-CoA decarboxylase subunit gamma
MKKLNVTVDGTVYEVILESATSGSANAASTEAAPKPQPGGGGDSVLSPLAGTVIAIEVSVGQSIREGDRLFTMEAMKMNTFITAEKSGKVSAVLVKEGEHVTEGQPLLDIA